MSGATATATGETGYAEKREGAGGGDELDATKRVVQRTRTRRTTSEVSALEIELQFDRADRRHVDARDRAEVEADVPEGTRRNGGVALEGLPRVVTQRQDQPHGGGYLRDTRVRRVAGTEDRQASEGREIDRTGAQPHVRSLPVPSVVQIRGSRRGTKVAPAHREGHVRSARPAGKSRSGTCEGVEVVQAHHDPG